ncbi:MAG: hypothetical protein V7K17_04405 [Nostoc sp.]
MSTMVTELVVPLRGSKLRAASRREVRAIRRRLTFKTVATHFYFLGKTYAVLHQNCCHSQKP